MIQSSCICLPSQVGDPLKIELCAKSKFPTRPACKCCRNPSCQWVLSLPFALLYCLTYDSHLVRNVLHIFIQVLFPSLRRRENMHPNRNDFPLQGMIHGFFTMSEDIDPGKKAIQQSAAVLRTAFKKYLCVLALWRLCVKLFPGATALKTKPEAVSAPA